ncbi:MAG: polysaccharide deacetylase family protein [Clostridia bacterium]|nr:polysaccharide deacetylase family protein [Clostridia bacterium]
MVLAAVAILFGGVFNFLGTSPPEITEPITTTEQETIEYESQIPESETQIPSVSTTEYIETEASTEPEISETIQSTEATENTVPSESEPPETTVPSETESQAEIPVEPIGAVYLTFDDGPSTQITNQILDILKEKNVKATFFIIDYPFDSEKEAIVIREFEEGHTVALHGTSHDYSKIYTSLDALIENFTTLQEKVKASTGYTSTVIRFPGGSSNTVSKKYCTGIMTEAVEYFSNSEFVYFDWNVDSRDAGGAKSSEEVFENVTSSLKPGRNNIVLMHDSTGKQYTLDALEAIIDFCISEGYEFKAITDETPQVTHNVSN